MLCQSPAISSWSWWSICTLNSIFLLSFAATTYGIYWRNCWSFRSDCRTARSILGWILTSISIWDILHNFLRNLGDKDIFTFDSNHRIMSLRQKLHMIRNGARSFTGYLIGVSETLEALTLAEDNVKQGCCHVHPCWFRRWIRVIHNFIQNGTTLDDWCEKKRTFSQNNAILLNMEIRVSDNPEI